MGLTRIQRFPVVCLAVRGHPSPSYWSWRAEAWSWKNHSTFKFQFHISLLKQIFTHIYTGCAAAHQICIILSPQSLNYVRLLHDIWRASPHRSTTIEVVKRKRFSKTAADICILLPINSVCLKDKNIRLFTEGTITFIQVFILFSPHDFVICIHIEIKFKYLSPFCTTRFLQVLQQEHAWLHSKMRGGSSRQNSGRRRPP